MSAASPVSATTLTRPFWLHLLLIAAMILSRRPDALLHPQFWAEDGQSFYHDAYMRGPAALLLPLGGYLNTFSRLVAALAVNFPLAWAPAMFAVTAFAVQLAPPAVMLSDRMAAALPSPRARLAMAYFYAAMPNSWELNVNLTNAQWHLAMLAFLLVVASPARHPAARAADALVLAVSGLSGPFDLFLVPLAWFEQTRRRDPARLTNALVLSAAGAVQLVCIAVSHATAVRRYTSLGATPARFLHIVTTQIVLGGLLGHRLTVHVAALPAFQGILLPLIAVVAAAAAIATAFATGPAIYRKAAFWSAALFGAALLTPLASQTVPQWLEMTHPGAALRYYIIPSLVWFATWLILAASPWRAARIAAFAVLGLTALGITSDWVYPRLPPHGFTAQATAFAASPPGTTATFPENPPGWSMVLTKP
jgi:hypothetical protein